mgnify:CR=1 FL=1
MSRILEDFIFFTRNKSYEILWNVSFYVSFGGYFTWDRTSWNISFEFLSLLIFFLYHTVQSNDHSVFFMFCNPLFYTCIYVKNLIFFLFLYFFSIHAIQRGTGVQKLSPLACRRKGRRDAILEQVFSSKYNHVRSCYKDLIVTNTAM